jgi:MerC mercury resistance protein
MQFIRKMTVLLKKYADQIGIAASTLCLIHCLVFPILMAFWAQHEHDAHQHAEHFLNWDHAFLLFSALAVWTATGRCTQPWLKRTMWTCFAMLAAGVLLEPFVHYAHLATLPAAVGLAAAHFFNWRYCQHSHV